MKLAALVATGLLFVSACEKKEGGAPGATTTAVASSDETALMQFLPAGANALFGGNYMKLQDFMQSGPFKKLMQASGALTPGMEEWMKCWTQRTDLKMIGVLKLSGGTISMPMVMKGMSIASIDECAKKANFTVATDADKKFISFEMPSAMGAMQTGYLDVGNGMLYTRVALPIGATTLPTSSRADLEGDIKALSSGTAAKDPVLAEAMTRVDRTKSVWFVGSGANTPVADKVGLVSGTIDITSGIAMDVNVQFKDVKVVDELMKGWDQAKQQAGSMGGVIADAVKSVTLTRNGDKVRFQVNLSNQLLEKLLDQMGGMLPGIR